MVHDMDYRDLEKLARQEQEQDQDRRDTAIDTTSVEAVIADYEVKVFTLAIDLLEDPALASEVAEEVFLRINSESEALPVNSEDINKLIHRYTYEAALPKLLNKRSKPLH